MEKILYIQIDNNSLPEGCGEDVEVLDCRCINDFCSFAGDALVGDLKDENGKPLYRLINPVGKLLMDFKTVNEEAFNSIIEGWYEILGNLLHKGRQGDDIEIKFPQQYVDWLLHNENSYYEKVGKELQKANGKITFSSEEIVDDIIASLNYKVRQTLQEKYSFIVFSNPIIRNSSYVVKKQVKIDGIEYLRYEGLKDTAKNNTEIEKTEKKEGFIEVFVDDIKFNMIYVMGGTFLMGPTTEQGETSGFDYVHPVTLSDFYISETLVPQGLWKKIMGEGKFFLQRGDDIPAIVTWNEGQEFIYKLSAFTGKKFRLPTEAEWEYAARGGINSKGYRFAGSNDYDEVAWHDNKLHRVALKKPNELGIYDMSGNHGEWCQDWYDEYSLFPEKNPHGPLKPTSSECNHVYRGNGFSFSDDSISTRRYRCIGEDSEAIRLVMEL